MLIRNGLRQPPIPWLATHSGEEVLVVPVNRCVLDLDEPRVLRRRWPLLQESRADVIAREAAMLAAEEF